MRYTVFQMELKCDIINTRERTNGLAQVVCNTFLMFGHILVWIRNIEGIIYIIFIKKIKRSLADFIPPTKMHHNLSREPDSSFSRRRSNKEGVLHFPFLPYLHSL